MEKRVGWIDTIKGVTIFLMVLGHVIQYANGNDYLQNSKFSENAVFLFIYSFHMPIFMFLSGFCFYRTCQKKKTRRIVLDKIKMFAFPFLGCNALTYLLVTLYNGQDILSPWNVINFFRENYNFLWFLWVILYCSIVMLLINRIFKDNIGICIAVILSGFFYPDIFNSINFKMMFPFFVLGYMCNKYEIIDFLEKNRVIYTIMSIFLIIAYILLYDSKVIMYWNFYGIHNVRYVFERWLINISGVWIIVSLFYEIGKRKQWYRIQKLGRHTLGVYLISMYICYYLVTQYTIKGDNRIVIVTCNIFLSIAITIMSYFSAIWINKVKSSI